MYFIGIYVIDQHEVVHNCEVEGNWYMVLLLLFFLQIKNKVWCAKVFTPFTLIHLNKIQCNHFHSEVT